MSTYEKLSGLELEVDSYELEPHEVQVSSEFTRLTTVIRLRGVVIRPILPIAGRDGGGGKRQVRRHRQQHEVARGRAVRREIDRSGDALAEGACLGRGHV